MPLLCVAELDEVGVGHPRFDVVVDEVETLAICLPHRGERRRGLLGIDPRR